MKKFYMNPAMDVKEFEAENIVTASGRTDGTEFTGTTDELKAAAQSVNTVSYDVLGFTF